jgi:hypothetical protein
MSHCVAGLRFDIKFNVGVVGQLWRTTNIQFNKSSPI